MCSFSLYVTDKVPRSISVAWLLLYLLLSEAENQPRVKYLKSLKRVEAPQRVGGSRLRLWWFLRQNKDTLDVI